MNQYIIIDDNGQPVKQPFEAASDHQAADLAWGMIKKIKNIDDTVFVYKLVHVADINLES